MPILENKIILKVERKNKMEINFSDIKNELLRHCIIHLISRKEFKNEGDEVINKTHENNGNCDLVFKINGIEFPILKWFNRLDEHIEDRIKERTEEMINEKLIEIEDQFTEIIEDIREKVLKNVGISRQNWKSKSYD